MLSSRTSWDLTPNRLALLVERARAEGRAILDLTESNPTRVGIRYPQQAILRALARSSALSYDPDPQGWLPAREAITRVFSARGLHVRAQDLFLTASTSEAYAWLFKLLADPGQEVLVPSPSYPLFEYLSRLESVRPVTYSLVYDGKWWVDGPALAKRVGPRTRAMVVVSPNNPTGSYLKRAELETIARLAREADLSLIGDEVFAEYPAGVDPDRVASVLEAKGCLSFSLGGLSKLAGLPQIKLGWIAIGGPARMREAARRRLEVIADTYLSVNTFAQHAAPRLLALARGIRSRIASRVAQNRTILEREIGAHSPCRMLSMEGGWSAVLRVPAVMSEEEWVLTLLEEDRVLVHPGYFFGFSRPAYLVMSLLPREREFSRGVRWILARSRSC